MLRTAILTFDLFILWLLLSGYFTPMLLVLGVISCLFTMMIAYRMKIIDSEGLPAQFSIFALLKYLAWLLKEIAKSNWAVSKVVAAPDRQIRQKLFDVPASQASDIGKVIFANSITLTPGTITVETEADHFLIHAVTEQAADMDALADMDHRVAITEKQGGPD